MAKKGGTGQNVPAFIVMHDTTLDDLCSKMPTSVESLRAVTGIGESKLEKYGKQILDVLARFQTGS